MAARLNNRNDGELSATQRKFIDGLRPGAWQTMTAAYMSGANAQKKIDSVLTDALSDFQHMIHELTIPIIRAETLRSAGLSLTQLQKSLQHEKKGIDAQFKAVNQAWEILRRAFKNAGNIDPGEFKHAYANIYQNVLDWMNALDGLAAGDELPFRNAPAIDFMSQIQPITRSGKTAKGGVSLIRHRGLELQAEKLTNIEIAIAIQTELENLPEHSDDENEALKDLQARHGKSKADYVGKILREKKSGI